MKIKIRADESDGVRKLSEIIKCGRTLAKKIDGKKSNESTRGEQWIPSGRRSVTSRGRWNPISVQGFPFFSRIRRHLFVCVIVRCYRWHTSPPVGGLEKGGPWARFSFLELWLFLFLLFSLLQQNKGKILSKSNKQKMKIFNCVWLLQFFFFLCLLSSAGNKKKKLLRATFSLLLVLCSAAIETVTTDARTHRGITKKK